VVRLMSENWFYRYQGLWRGSLPTAEDILQKDHRPPVIYLRSFADELSEYSLRKVFSFRYQDQEFLAQFMNMIGPYIALGRPGEPFPELGAARMYVSNDEWQQVVAGLIDVAAAIVVQGAPSHGLCWELSELVRRATPSKILLIPPQMRKEYDEFRVWADRVLPKPMPVALSKQAMVVTPANSERYFLAFHSDWEPYSMKGRFDWALQPFFCQNGFPFPKKSIAEKKREKLLARVEAKLPGALDAYRSELAITARSAAASPKNAGWQREIAVAHEKLGDVLRAQDNVVGAREAYRTSTTIMERLAAADSKNVAWQRELAVVRGKLARHSARVQ
jgi:hypothetical protein